MKENYTPGGGCLCHAHSESECGCDVDWTPREVYELREQRDEARETIAMMEIRHAAVMLHTQDIVDEANQFREQRDRLAEALQKFEGCFDCYGCVGTAEQALAAVKGENNE